MKALIDTNVVVDVLQQRQPWCESGNAIFLAAANHVFDGCLTAKEIADIHFFARKQFRGQDNVDAQARNVVAKLMSLFEVIDTLSADCQTAIGIDNNDYEDAIMIASAQRAGVECIITRNPDHYRAAQISIYDPDAFLKQIHLP